MALIAAGLSLPMLMLTNLSVKAILPAWSLKWYSSSTKPFVGDDRPHQFDHRGIELGRFIHE